MNDEMPPSWMWHIDTELEIWFENVEEKRKKAYSTGGDEDEAPDMTSNELAKGRRG